MVEREETTAYAIAALGAAVDHASTDFVLRIPGFYETNAFVRRMIEMDVWTLVDVACVAGSILLCAFLIRRINPEHKHAKLARYMFLAAPVIAGIIRLSAGFWNIAQLLI